MKDTPREVPAPDPNEKRPIPFNRRGIGISPKRQAEIQSDLLHKEAMGFNEQTENVKTEILAAVEKQFSIITDQKREVAAQAGKSAPPSKIISIFKGDEVPEYLNTPTAAELDELYARYVTLKNQLLQQEIVLISKFDQFILERHFDTIKNPIDFLSNNNAFLTWMSQFLG